MKFYKVTIEDGYVDEMYFKDENFKDYIFKKCFPDTKKYKEVIKDSVLISSKHKNHFYLDENNYTFERFIMPDVADNFFKFKKAFEKNYDVKLPQNPTFEFVFEATYKKDRLENNKVIYTFQKQNVKVYVIPSTFDKYIDKNGFEYYFNKIKIFEKEYKQLLDIFCVENWEFFDIDVIDTIDIGE